MANPLVQGIVELENILQFTCKMELLLMAASSCNISLRPVTPHFHVPSSWKAAESGTGTAQSSSRGAAPTGRVSAGGTAEPCKARPAHLCPEGSPSALHVQKAQGRLVLYSVLRWCRLVEKELSTAARTNPCELSARDNPRNFKQQFLETIWRPAWEFCKTSYRSNNIHHGPLETEEHQSPVKQLGLVSSIRCKRHTARLLDRWCSQRETSDPAEPER
ncbi:uncharacterized protein LOC118170053 [Oxyura jamaicensis]|uniref:uncharacterized protein LOC118170053 n=1 Tax=Oxyura jamaicensis TaxID=8884 RepID=UPI0015A60E23|nr:uncharacterized protein LOC118170053 [Oxyura jamaicensis]